MIVPQRDIGTMVALVGCSILREKRCHEADFSAVMQYLDTQQRLTGVMLLYRLYLSFNVYGWDRAGFVTCAIGRDPHQVACVSTSGHWKSLSAVESAGATFVPWPAFRTRYFLS